MARQLDLERRERQRLAEIEGSLNFHVYKMVLQLFFNLYEKSKCEEITSYKKMLNWLVNQSKQQFLSFQGRPDRLRA